MDRDQEEQPSYFRSTTNRDDSAPSLKELAPLAASGDAKAQYSLGRLYANGRGVRRDFKVAYDWFERAAKQEHIEARYAIARMYERGDGVKQSHEMAQLWRTGDVPQLSPKRVYAKTSSPSVVQAKVINVIPGQDTLTATTIKPALNAEQTVASEKHDVIEEHHQAVNDHVNKEQDTLTAAAINPAPVEDPKIAEEKNKAIEVQRLAAADELLKRQAEEKRCLAQDRSSELFQASCAATLASLAQKETALPALQVALEAARTKLACPSDLTSRLEALAEYTIRKYASTLKISPLVNFAEAAQLECGKLVPEAYATISPSGSAELQPVSAHNEIENSEAVAKQ